MGLDAAEQALKEDLERKRKKNRFGDEYGRVGRRRKGQGKHFQEEVDRFGADDGDDMEEERPRHRLDKSESSMKQGRDLKQVEGAAEDWEHEEDSEEESERRRYEEESGFRVEPFNTDMEREDGHFESGHFIEDKFKMSQRDAWLDEVADKYAHGKKEAVPKKKPAKDEEEMVEEVDPQSLLKFLTQQLQPEENVAAALRRMRAAKTSAEEFDALTEAADKLLASGYHSVFSDSREKIQTKVKVELQESEDDGRYWEYKCQVDDSSIPNIDTKKMSIKALRAFLDQQGVSYEGIVEKEDLDAKAMQTVNRMRNQANQIHGPFSTAQMRQWARQGYFSGERVALIRQRVEGREGGDDDFVRSDRIEVEDMLA